MRILLAIDGSRESRGAEAVLSQFPFATPVELHVATVCPVSDLHALAPSVPMAVNDMVDRCRQESQELLDQTSARCNSWAGSVESKLLDGHPAQELLKLADELKPELIVVGARGLGAVARVMLGSVSERIAKHAPCSVLVIRQSEVHPETRKILIAFDGSRGSQRVIERFAGLPLGKERTVYLQTVVETFHAYGMDIGLEAEGVYERERLEAQARLNEAVDRLRHVAPQVETLVEESVNAADGLIQTAHEEGIDLIALGSAGKNAWERFLMGSVSVRVLHHAPCSVWIERGP